MLVPASLINFGTMTTDDALEFSPPVSGVSSLRPEFHNTNPDAIALVYVNSDAWTKAIIVGCRCRRCRRRRAYRNR